MIVYLLNKTICPVCGLTGVSVSKITVEHLVTDECRAMVNGMNENCDDVYYSPEKDNEKNNPKKPPKGKGNSCC